GSDQELVFQLLVRDADGLIAVDEVTITVNHSLARTISGRVTVRGSGNALEGLVNCGVKAISSRGEERSAKTDVNGDYIIETLTGAADLVVFASPPDGPIAYSSQYYNKKEERGDADKVSTVLASLSGVDFQPREIPSYIIQGRVEDENSAGLPGAKVNIHSEKTRYGDFGETDSNGDFSFQGLKNADDYVVFVYPEGYPPSYYHGDNTVHMWKYAEMIEPNGPRLTLSLEKGFTIRGRISRDGIPLSGVRVEVEAGPGSGSDFKINTKSFEEKAEEGINYKVTVPDPGVYKATVIPGDSPPRTAEVVVSGSVETLDIHLDPPLRRTLGGRVSGLESEKDASIHVWSTSTGVHQAIEVSGAGETVGYSFAGLPPADDYQVELVSGEPPHRAHRPVNGSARGIFVDLTREDVDDVDFALDQDAYAIEGVIVFPVADDHASVRVDAWSATSGSGASVALEKLPGPRQKNYSITGLPPADDYIVRARLENYLDHYYAGPGGEAAADPALAGRIDISESDRLGVDITIFSPGASISGKVHAAGGGVASDIYVEARSDSGAPGASSVTDENGDFTIGGLSDQRAYTLAFRGSVGGLFFYTENGGMVCNRFIARRIVASIDSPGYIDDVTLPSTGEISGKATDPEGLGLGGIWMEAASDSTMCRAGGATDKNGEYTIRGLLPGSDYTVAALPPGSATSRKLPDRSMGETEVDFVLDVDSGFSLPGVVKNEQGDLMAGVRVEIWSESLSIRGEIWAITDGNGKFLFERLPKSGDYTILVWPPGDSGLAFHQESFDLTEAYIGELEITLVSTGDIRGEITGKDETTPIEGVEITAASTTFPFFAQTVSNAFGAWEITGVPENSEYHVTVRKESYVELTRKIQRPGSGVDFSLSEAGAIRGGVVAYKDTDQPLPSVRVAAFSEKCRNGEPPGALESAAGCSGAELTDDEGKYEIKGLRKNDSEGGALDDYVVTVYYDNYPADSKGGRFVGATVDFVLSRNPENKLEGS
ncbi:MAG: hypothetical protein GY859_12650, partial [Desulfobacterales bacterium]|nr:hypothetical protein [Desulfobacterales bacterium]